MKNKIKELNLTEQESKDLVNWLDNYGLKEIHDYQENWKFVTDISEKFNEEEHGKVCCICGKRANLVVNNKLYCGKHNSQLTRHNRIIPITRFTPNEIKIYEDYASIITRDKYGEVTGEFLIEDESVFSVLDIKWRRSNHGYCINHEPSRFLHCHIFATDQELDKNVDVIDHINQDTFDNRIRNLRVIPRRVNVINSKLRSDNTTGYKGVSYKKEMDLYRVRIVDLDTGKHITVGYERQLYEAIVMRLNAEVKYYGKFAPQRHLYEKYNIDDSSVEYDPPYVRPIKMTLLRALELYKQLITL